MKAKKEEIDHYAKIAITRGGTSFGVALDKVGNVTAPAKLPRGTVDKTAELARRRVFQALCVAHGLPEYLFHN